MSIRRTKQQVVATLRALKPELEAVYHMKSVALFGALTPQVHRDAGLLV